MGGNKTYRLASVEKEFNVGRRTIVGTLEKKGYDVSSLKTLNSKISQEMYDFLVTEFHSDKTARKKSDVIIFDKKENTSNQPSAPKFKESKENIHKIKAPSLQGPKFIDKKIDLNPVKKPTLKQEEEEVATPIKPINKSQEGIKAVKSDSKKSDKADKKGTEIVETKLKVLKGLSVQGKIKLPEKKTTPADKKNNSPFGKRKRHRIPVHNQNKPKQGGNKKDNYSKKHFKELFEKDKIIDEKEIQEKIRLTQAKIGELSRSSKSSKAKYRKQKREEVQLEKQKLEADTKHEEKTIQVTEFISLSEFASLINIEHSDIISKCLDLGLVVSINQRLDSEVLELLASEYNFKLEFADAEKDITDNVEDEKIDEATAIERSPIVTVMGHVDHGKTSLLDYIRKEKVTADEAGGITQHIGAYEVHIKDNKMITFLDTPGHEAFTAMRARGAKVTDIVVIVIAADDAVMPQTKEAISHAQAAGVPMVFAINKMDKEGAKPEKIKEQLSTMDILVEDWGGKFQCQEISAKAGLNIDILLDKILLEADILELKANKEVPASGTIIEASLDKGRGYITKLLIRNGSLKVGDMLVSGQYFGKVKTMLNDRNKKISVAGPSNPVLILGMNGAPQAGESFKVYTEESKAKEIAAKRSQLIREQGIRTKKHITLDEIGRRLSLGTFKELNLIIKGDVDGSVEALSDSFQKLSTDKVVVKVILKGVGQITENDVLLASASDAIIVGFQVRPSGKANRLAEKENIQIKIYSVIYDAIDEIRKAMEGLLEPTIEEKLLGTAEVKDIFKINKLSIAGCVVNEGKILRNSNVRLIREGIVKYTGELSSLKHFKEDVKEISYGSECGLTIKNYSDVKVGDVIEAFEEKKVKTSL